MALDGDVDFSPEALQLLIDRMKKNPKVGATCGRIKPGGSGNTAIIICIHIYTSNTITVVLYLFSVMLYIFHCLAPSECKPSMSWRCILRFSIVFPYIVQFS
jgi:hypothetical protein